MKGYWCLRDVDKQIGGGLMLEVAAAIIKTNNKYLICQRADDDNNALLWEFPGGKREAGESLEECIFREIKEELNLTIKVISVYKKMIHCSDGREIYFTFFNCDILSGELVLNVHKDARWVTVHEMRNYNFMPADVGIIYDLIR